MKVFMAEMKFLQVLSGRQCKPPNVGICLLTSGFPKIGSGVAYICNIAVFGRFNAIGAVSMKISFPRCTGVAYVRGLLIFGCRAKLAKAAYVWGGVASGVCETPVWHRVSLAVANPPPKRNKVSGLTE